MGTGRALGARGIYLDASAVVKLIRREAETEALLSFLTKRQLRVSSLILTVELACFCHRQGLDPEDAREILSGLLLVPLSSEIIERACLPFSPPQRALDALHLSTAERARNELELFVSYDSDQARAARRLGWQIERPA